MTIRIGRPGGFTTVQDLGRRGWQRDGVPVGGAMDDVALRIANWLVGNPGGAAALEATLVGPAIEVREDTLIAVTGADMDARVGEARLPPWHAVRVRAGDSIVLEGARRGCRAYLAFAGGIDVPCVLGSRSTYTRAGIGGHRGRALERHDELRLGETKDGLALRTPARGVHVAHLDLRREVVRMTPGPHLPLLPTASRRSFFESQFSLAAESDRMGLRFVGEPLALRTPVEVRSGGVAMGTVQLPPGGAPIVLMADRQTTGGYPRLGEVATVDLPVLAQLRPGDAVQFAEITHAEAERLYLEREHELRRLQRFLTMPS